jgi:sodium-dependent dicarboxylate transporter 2/3/5
MGANSTSQLQLSGAARAGLVAGLLVLAFTLLVPPPGGLTHAAWQTAGLALLMAIWWSTGPVPIDITALLPLIVLPLLGIGDISAAAQPYANPLVFLFLGGFLLAAGVQRWGLHRRLPRRVVQVAGTSPRRSPCGSAIPPRSFCCCRSPCR